MYAAGAWVIAINRCLGGGIQPASGFLPRLH